MELREHIAAPYRAWNGAVITCCEHIATYNRIQDQINSWIRANRPVPEWLLDWSHRHFSDICSLAKEKADA